MAVSRDICVGSENLSVCYSDDSSERVANFEYVCCNIPGPGLDTSLFEDTIQGCSCDICVESPTDYSPHTCSCLSRSGGRAYNNHRQLKEEFFEVESSVLFECNHSCSCSFSCSNRVVQHGLKYRLEIFYDIKKGLSLRTLEPIFKNTFVCEYAGEILTPDEAKHRFQFQTPNDMNYIFILREHFSSGLFVTIVDPKSKGNIGRFLNHSCEPNLKVVPIRVHIMIPKLCLFATRHIEAGEELTYDYSSEQVDTLGESQSKTANKEYRKPCFCGSKNCKGLLPFDVNVL